MPNLNPTVNTTPDQSGTLAVSGISNNGHTSTVTTVGASDFQSNPPQFNSQSKSARWSSFESPPGAISSLTLRFNWTITADIDAIVEIAGSASSSISFVIEYSTDGGSTWIQAISKSLSVSVGANQSDSDTLTDSGSVAISVGLPTSLIQVRDRMDAHANANAPNQPGAEASSGASVTTTISSIVLDYVAAPSPSSTYRGGGGCM